jgi:hypothetical protein
VKYALVFRLQRQGQTGCALRGGGRATTKRRGLGAGARPDGTGTADTRPTAHGKFLLEPLEPRVLLSADSILGEVYRSLVDDEARSASPSGGTRASGASCCA